MVDSVVESMSVKFLEPTTDETSTLEQMKESEIIPVVFPGACIGEGSYGQVYDVFWKKSAGSFVCKIAKDAYVGHLIREISILRIFNHPNVIDIKQLVRLAVSETTQSVGFLMDKYNTTLSEILTVCPRDTARSIIGQLISALAHVHSHGIVHGDVKPSNVLVKTELDGSMTVRLCDFGYARAFVSEELRSLSPPCADLYRPPDAEVFYTDTETGHLRVEYRNGFPVDIWALGILALQLWTQERFTEKNKWTTEKVKELLHEESPVVVDFFIKVLDPNWKTRATATDLMHHGFLSDAVPRAALMESIDDHRYHSSFPPHICFDDWKNACSAVLAWASHFDHDIVLFYAAAQILSQLDAERFTCPYSVTSCYMLAYTALYGECLHASDMMNENVDHTSPLYAISSALDDEFLLHHTLQDILYKQNFTIPFRTFAQYLSIQFDVLYNTALIAAVVCGAIFTHPPQTLANICKYILYTPRADLSLENPVVAEIIKLAREWNDLNKVDLLALHLQHPVPSASSHGS